MDVITTFSTILSSVKTATEIVNILKESDLSLESAEAKLKIAEIVSALADVKMQLADVRELLLEKDEEISRLQEELRIKGNMVFERPYYWLKLEGDNKEGPFCQVCYDKDKKFVRLQGEGDGFWQCNVCKNTFTDGNYDESSYAEHISF